MNLPLDFDSIDDVLQRVESGITASESQGALCGLLCAQPNLDTPMWLHHTLIGCDPENAHLPEARNHLLELAASSIRQLNDADYGFHPLLPDDDALLQVRTHAVSLWCQGFLEGLRLGGVKYPDQLPGDAGEVARDLAEISKANRFAVAENNENEADFAELVEYLRAGIRLVYEELRSPTPAMKPISSTPQIH